MKLFIIYISLVFSFFVHKGCKTGKPAMVFNDVTGYVNKGEEGVPEYIGKLDGISQINLMGDSISYGEISGFIDKNEKNLCYYMSKDLDVPVVNYGIGGNALSISSETAGVSACDRLKTIEYQENDITILFSGTNDCGGNVSLEVFRKAYIQAIENWKSNSKSGAKLILTTLLPRTNFIKAERVYLYSTKHANTPKYSKVIREVYESYKNDGSIYLCDIEKECTGTKNGGLPNPRFKNDNTKYFGDSGLHPNLTGYHVYGTWFAKYLYSNFGAK